MELEMEMQKDKARDDFDPKVNTPHYLKKSLDDGFDNFDSIFKNNDFISIGRGSAFRKLLEYYSNRK